MRETRKIAAAGGPGVTRRRFSQGLGATALAAGLLPVGFKGARAAQEIDLTVFTWAGYEIPELNPEFIEKYGAKPNYSFFAEEEAAFQKLRAGFKTDLSHPCTLSLRRWRDAGLLQPIDVSRIPRWDDIYPVLKDVTGVVVDGDVYMLPWEWGNSSILYRTDEVEPKAQSYELLLDARYKGRVSIFDSVDEAFVIGAALIGAEDHKTMSDAQIEEAADALREVHKNVRFYWTDNTALNQAVASGEVWIAWAWNDSVVSLTQQDVPVKYMQPQEGISTWMCGYTMHEGAPGSAEQAYDFLNARLDPEVGKYVVEKWGYGFANANTFDLVDPGRLTELGFGGDVGEFLAGSRFQGEIPPKKREKMISLWEQIKAGY